MTQLEIYLYDIDKTNLIIPFQTPRGKNKGHPRCFLNWKWYWWFSVVSRTPNLPPLPYIPLLVRVLYISLFPLIVD